MPAKESLPPLREDHHGVIPYSDPKLSLFQVEQEKLDSGPRVCMLGNKNRRTHGMVKSAEYSIWRNIKARCGNPSHPAYVDYGGRGIAICSRWLKFENFLEDMGRRPSASHSVDRFPDPDGNYEPGNCRWATPTDQARNRRSNHTLSFDGITLSLAEWAEKTGISSYTLSTRFRLGWSVERILTTPIRKQSQTWRKPHAVNSSN